MQVEMLIQIIICPRILPNLNTSPRRVESVSKFATHCFSFYLDVFAAEDSLSAVRVRLADDRRPSRSRRHRNVKLK